MAVRQKEIEREIEKLASFVDSKILDSKHLFMRLSPYLDQSGKNISGIIKTVKPVIKKQVLNIEILVLKAQLLMVKRRIADQNAGNDRESEESE